MIERSGRTSYHFMSIERPFKYTKGTRETNTLRAALPVLSMWPCKRKFDEEKTKHAGLAQGMPLAQYLCRRCRVW